MAFNSKKFEILRYGWDEELNNSTEYLTAEAEDLIERKGESKCLTMESFPAMLTLCVAK